MPTPTNEQIMSRLPAPEPNEVRIVLLVGENAFVAHETRARIEEVMNAFERRAGLSVSARTSRETQAMIRIQAAETLRRPDAEQRFKEVIASAVAWLAFRHWSNGDDIAKGVDALIAEGKHPVVTAAIAEPDATRRMPDTAWAFMVGETVIDGRRRLEGLPPYIVEVEMDQRHFGDEA